MSGKKRFFTVRGMRCAGCAANVEKTVAGLSRAADVYVNFAGGCLSLSTPAELLPDHAVIAAVESLGFEAAVRQEDAAAEDDEEARRSARRDTVPAPSSSPVPRRRAPPPACRSGRASPRSAGTCRCR